MKYTKQQFNWRCPAAQRVFHELVGFPSEKNSLKEVNLLLKEVPLKEKAKILDVGCGTGRHSIILQKKGFNVTGIDVAFQYLKLARIKAKHEGLSVIFKKQAAADLNIKNHYDAALAYNHTIGFFSPRRLSRHFKAIYKALKSKGVFFLKTAGPVNKIRTKQKTSIQIVGDSYIVENQQIRQGVRHETCVIINFKQGTISEFNEKQEIYDYKKIRECLFKTGFQILKSKQKTNGYKNYNIFICHKK